MSFNVPVRNYLFLKNYITSEGAISLNVWYYQQLSIVHSQVNFMLTIILNNYQKFPVPLKVSLAVYTLGNC